MEAGRRGAEEAEGKGEGQGQRAVGRRRADPFNIADVLAGVDAGRGQSVVDDIVVLSEDEGQGARKMAVEGGPGQPTAPNVPEAAMKSILPEVRRQEECKGGLGQQAASAAGSGDSGVRTGERGQTDKGGKAQAGTSGARHAKGRQEGKGGKGVGALVAPGGSLARRGSSHCPRRSLSLIAVATLFLLRYIRLLQPCLRHVTRPDGARWYLVGGCADLHRALRELSVVPEFEV